MLTEWHRRDQNCQRRYIIVANIWCAILSTNIYASLICIKCTPIYIFVNKGSIFFFKSRMWPFASLLFRV